MWELKDYRLAADPAEALHLLREGPGVGRFIAGGTDLFLDRPPCDFVVDISRAGLDGVAVSDQGDLAIGAATTLQTLAESEAVGEFAGGALARVAALCGNRPVRTTATLGGNLCQALPSADMAPVLLALDATCLIMGQDEQGEVEQESVPLKDFFVGPRLTVLEGRLLAGLYLPAASRGWRCYTRKFTRSAEDICLVQVAVSLGVEQGVVREARIALGAVAPVPLRSTLAENMLVDQSLEQLTDDVLRDAAEIAAGEAQPIDDHRASAAYRRDLVRILTRRLLIRALQDNEEGGAA